MIKMEENKKVKKSNTVKSKTVGKTKSETKKSKVVTEKTNKTKSTKTKKVKVVTEKTSKSKSVKAKSEAKKTKVVAEITEPKHNDVKKYYYMFRMNTYILNILSFFLIILSAFIFYLIYGSSSIDIVNNNIYVVIILYIPYLILHEQLHSLAYVIYGADFKKITYGAHLEKGILCCLCKQNINKRNIIHSLLYPFIIIGIITLIIGIIVNYPVLVILSLANISGCSGDLLMFYHLSKLKDFEFSEYNDPIAFGLYSKKDLSNLKLFGLDYVGRKYRLERNDLKKVVISKKSIIILAVFYALIIFVMVA